MYSVLKISATAFLFSLADLYFHEFTWSYHNVIHFSFIIQYSQSRYQCLDRLYQIVLLVFFLVHFPNFRSIFLLQIKLFTLMYPKPYFLPYRNFQFSFLTARSTLIDSIQLLCWNKQLAYLTLVHFLLVSPITCERIWQKCNDLRYSTWAHNSV